MIKEIECRFLEIDKDALVAKLIAIGAEDLGEVLLQESIFYDRDLKWRDEESRHVRIRRAGDKITLTYKERTGHTIDGTHELEFEISDFKKAELFLEKVGLVLFRRNEKKRHTLVWKGVHFDIDTWPTVPPYVELEGESEEAIQGAAKAAGLDWAKAEFHAPRWVLEHVYHIPIDQMHWFTFDRRE